MPDEVTVQALSTAPFDSYYFLFKILGKSLQVYFYSTNPNICDTDIHHKVRAHVSRVPHQNGVPLLYIMLEIHHYGWETLDLYYYSQLIKHKTKTYGLCFGAFSYF